MADRPTTATTEIAGRLEAYRAGEGRAIIWSIHEAARPGPEGVHPLLNGDFLTVYDNAGACAWSGIVDLDFDLYREPDPDDPATGVQVVLGHKVNGLQRYISPERWAQLFLERQKALLQRYRVPLPWHVGG